MAKNLVVHFSINGLTARLADTVHRVVGGDRFEIVPAEPYTAADLEWNDPESRTSKEGRDKSILPAIRDRVEKMEDYDTLYVGFPIWWYTAPNIIFSFLASYDLRERQSYRLRHRAAVRSAAQRVIWLCLPRARR